MNPVSRKYNYCNRAPVSTQNSATSVDLPPNIIHAARIAKKTTAAYSATNRRPVLRHSRLNDVVTRVTASHFTVVGNSVKQGRLPGEEVNRK